jgi:hypothetical protein
MMISNLVYEEIVLLQEILISVDESGIVPPDDQEIFETLYEKVISS